MFGGRAAAGQFETFDACRYIVDDAIPIRLSSLQRPVIYDYDLSVILPRLTGPLREILDAEVSAGNVMVEVSSCWPMPNVNVWLRDPLTRNYADRYPQLEYRYLGDPRNWLEEYIDRENGAMVAAKCS